MLVSITGIAKFVYGTAKKLMQDGYISPEVNEEPIIEEPIVRTKVEYCMFPMETINITTRANSLTHTGYQAWDLAGKDGGIENVYAPFTCKVLTKYPYPSTCKINDGNTFIIGSCNELGEKTAVMCEDGIERVLSFAITHDNNINDLAVNQIIKSGDILCQEGKAGNATGNHIHIEPAQNWQYFKHIIGTCYVIDNNCAIDSLFYRLKGYNIDKNLNGYTFKTVCDRWFYA